MTLGCTIIDEQGWWWTCRMAGFVELGIPHLTNLHWSETQVDISCSAQSVPRWFSSSLLLSRPLSLQLVEFPIIIESLPLSLLPAATQVLLPKIAGTFHPNVGRCRPWAVRMSCARRAEDGSSSRQEVLQGRHGSTYRAGECDTGPRTAGGGGQRCRWVVELWWFQVDQSLELQVMLVVHYKWHRHQYMDVPFYLQLDLSIWISNNVDASVSRTAKNNSKKKCRSHVGKSIVLNHYW